MPRGLWGWHGKKDAFLIHIKWGFLNFFKRTRLEETKIKRDFVQGEQKLIFLREIYEVLKANNSSSLLPSWFLPAPLQLAPRVPSTSIASSSTPPIRSKCFRNMTTSVSPRNENMNELQTEHFLEKGRDAKKFIAQTSSSLARDMSCFVQGVECWERNIRLEGRVGEKGAQSSCFPAITHKRNFFPASKWARKES